MGFRIKFGTFYALCHMIWAQRQDKDLFPSFRLKLGNESWLFVAVRA